MRVWLEREPQLRVGWLWKTHWSCWAAVFCSLGCLELAEMLKISGKEGRPYSILFRGCSFLIIYEAGVLSALRDLSPDIMKSAYRIYGSSSGSIIATAGLCGCDVGKGYTLLFILCLKRWNSWEFLRCKRFLFHSQWIIPHVFTLLVSWRMDNTGKLSSTDKTE